MDFLAITTPVSLGDNRFSIDVPDGWQQGRGAFGGYVVAALIRAIESVENTDERPLRALTAELCGPLLTGPATISVEILRRGSGMTTAAARIIQDGVVAHAVGMMGRSRSDFSYEGIRAPEMPAYENTMVLPTIPTAPVFTQFIEYRITKNFPYSGANRAEVETWVKMKNAGLQGDGAYVAAMVDSVWPALTAVMSEPRPMSTVSYTLQLMAPTQKLDPNDPMYFRGTVLSAQEGHSAEMRELWTRDGKLVAINHQTIATIR